MIRGEDGTALRVRRASPFEGELLAALHASCFGTAEHPSQQRAWDASAMTLLMGGPSTLCLVATAGADDPSPIGFLVARAAADEAELLTIGVLECGRRRGVGRALLEEATARLKAMAARTLFLEVDETNRAALALYKRLGAEAVGRRPNYYEGGGNAAVLRLDLQSCSSGSTTR